jgi:hypothetical protein
MRFVIQHVPGQRQELLDALRRALPEAEVVECDGRPMQTFLRTLRPWAHWHLEDDVLLAPDFLARAEIVVQDHGEGLINGFAARPFPEGFRPGSSYMWNQCVFLPAGFGPAIEEFAGRWPRLMEHPTGFDLLIRDWLVKMRKHFWLISPSLVQHAEVRSLLGPARSKHRVSQSFRETYEVSHVASTSTDRLPR